MTLNSLPNACRNKKRITPLITLVHRLSDSDTTACSEQTSRHIHRRKLLEQKLGSIRNDDLRNLGLVLARTALELVLAQAGNRCHQAANLADVNSESIADIKKTLLQEGRRSVRNHTVTFHFSETQTSISSTTFDRLTGEDLQRSSGSSVNLVVCDIC